MSITPEPSADDRPFCEPVAVTLEGGEQVTLEFEPVQNDAEFRVGTVAISKRAEAEYEIRMDDQVVFGPAPIPPTDIDDLQMTWFPAYGFSQSLTVIVRDFKDTTGGRRFSVQPVGFEVMD